MQRRFTTVASRKTKRTSAWTEEKEKKHKIATRRGRTSHTKSTRVAPPLIQTEETHGKAEERTTSTIPKSCFRPTITRSTGSNLEVVDVQTLKAQFFISLSYSFISFLQGKDRKQTRERIRTYVQLIFFNFNFVTINFLCAPDCTYLHLLIFRQLLSCFC